MLYSFLPAILKWFSILKTLIYTLADLIIWTATTIILSSAVITTVYVFKNTWVGLQFVKTKEEAPSPHPIVHTNNSYFLQRNWKNFLSPTEDRRFSCLLIMAPFLHRRCFLSIVLYSPVLFLSQNDASNVCLHACVLYWLLTRCLTYMRLLICIYSKFMCEVLTWVRFSEVD